MHALIAGLPPPPYVFDRFVLTTGHRLNETGKRGRTELWGVFRESESAVELVVCQQQYSVTNRLRAPLPCSAGPTSLDSLTRSSSGCDRRQTHADRGRERAAEGLSLQRAVHPVGQRRQHQDNHSVLPREGLAARVHRLSPLRLAMYEYTASLRSETI